MLSRPPDYSETGLPCGIDQRKSHPQAPWEAGVTAR
jgi:hypothetical protein